MDEAKLRRLGSRDISGIPELRDLAAWCLEMSEATGDARYCGIARTPGLHRRRWERDGSILTRTLAFQRDLPSVLDALTAEEGAGLARLMREEFEDLLSH